MHIFGTDVVTSSISTALDAASMRQQVHAHNIANAQTAGFRPGRLSFGNTMDAMSSGTRADAPADSLRGSVVLGAPDSVRLDEEVAAMSQNAAHYQALLRALNRHLSVMNAAVSDGKR